MRPFNVVKAEFKLAEEERKKHRRRAEREAYHVRATAPVDAPSSGGRGRGKARAAEREALKDAEYRTARNKAQRLRRELDRVSRGSEV